MKLRPMPGKVILDPIDEEYIGRIIIPDTVKDRDMPHIGRVVAMNGALLTKKGVRVLAEFRPGQKVLFKKFAGLFVEWAGKRYVQVGFGDIMAILE